jgi:uncharacterized protein
VSNHLRAVAWAKDDPLGVEFAEVRLAADRLSATGVAIGVDLAPYRLDYTLETGEGFVTSRLHVTAVDEDGHRTLELRRSPGGRWSADAELPDLAGALDCDLGLSPLTNTMPVLRERLVEPGDPVDFVMAWVSVPDLEVHASPQRYVPLGGGVVRFESLDDDFTAEITFDADGLVVDYPGIGRRLRSPSGG